MFEFAPRVRWEAGLLVLPVLLVLLAGGPLAAAALPGGGLFVAFEAETVEGVEGIDQGGGDVRAQCVGATGTPLLYRGNSSAAIFVRDLPEHSPLALSDGRGGVIVIGLAELPPKPGLPSGIVAIIAHRLALTEANELKVRHPMVIVGMTLGPDVHPCAAQLEGP